MKLSLELSPSFSLELFSWSAVAPVGERGSVTARWRAEEGPEERRHGGWVHPFVETRLRSVLSILEGLPERVGPSIDDAGEQRIMVEDAGASVLRVRMSVGGRTDASTRAFDALWRELYRPAQRCLIELGVPRRLL